MPRKKILVDGRKADCGLCVKNEILSVVGFYNQTGVQILHRKLVVFPTGLANSIYSQTVPINYCPFCGRELEDASYTILNSDLNKYGAIKDGMTK